MKNLISFPSSVAKQQDWWLISDYIVSYCYYHGKKSEYWLPCGIIYLHKNYAWVDRGSTLKYFVRVLLLAVQRCSDTFHFLNLLLNITYFKIRCIRRAKAQAASCWLPTAAAWVRFRFRSCGICGEQSGTGSGFLRVLWFPLLIIPLIAPHSSP
jgi:hypothetical protein